MIEHRKTHTDALLAFEAEAEPAPSSAPADRESQVLVDGPSPLDAYGSQDHVDPVYRRQSAGDFVDEVAPHATNHAVAPAAVRRIAAPIAPAMQRPAMGFLWPMTLGGALAIIALVVWAFSGEPSVSPAPAELVSRGVLPTPPPPIVADAERAAVSADTVEPTTTFQSEPAGSPQTSERVAIVEPVLKPSEPAPSPEFRVPLEAAAPSASPILEREAPVDPRPLLAVPPETVTPPSGAPFAVDRGSAGRVPQRDTAAVADASGVSSSIPTPARELAPVLTPSAAAESSNATGERPLDESETVAPPVEVVPALAAEDAVRGTLGRYAAAFEAMDVEATAQIWPSVDQRALARAFRGLESQRVAFDACDIDVVTQSRAVADCRGTVRYIARLGDGAPRTEGRRWLFRLNRQGNEWRIDRLEASRP